MNKNNGGLPAKCLHLSKIFSGNLKQIINIKKDTLTSNLKKFLSYKDVKYMRAILT